MSAFHHALRHAQPSTSSPRRWVYVPYDQLTHEVGPLLEHAPDELGVVLVESAWKGRRRPYHKQKLALVLANMRHFALEQARRGVAVRYVHGDAPYSELLAPVIDELGTLRVMRPAEFELRQDLSKLGEGILEVAHDGWLTQGALFDASQGKKKSWRMDAFYRAARRSLDILMDGESPVGGKFSFDADNREPWGGAPAAPSPPVFAPDEITLEVVALVEARFGDHPGHLDATTLPATAEDAATLWAWAKAHCMEYFGPYEDAMSTASRTAFHTLISQTLNLHRLLPSQVIEDVAGMELPLNSKEGFVRQVLGWREFVHHVHERTQGFRELPAARRTPPLREHIGDARWGEYSGNPAKNEDGRFAANACPSAMGSREPLPRAFWGDSSGMFCLDHVVDGVMKTGYSHHIERLMILGNIATLLDVSPRELTDWFWASYVDAYDWVVEPNVLGMATFGLGDLFTTKPYVAGSNYINKMSDYCASCAFHPTKTCPISHMYWAFLARHEPALSQNFRMNLTMGSLRKRSDVKKGQDERVFARVQQRLAAGQALTTEDVVKAREGEES